MAVSAGTGYLDVAPRIVKSFSRDLTNQLVKPMVSTAAKGGAEAGKAAGAALAAPMGRAADKTGRETGRRIGGGLKAASGMMLAPLRLLGPAMAAAFGGAAVLAGIKDVTNEAREAAVVGKQTTAVLKSTGGAANISARQVAKLAEALSNKVGVDDEAIQSAQNLLLTFTGVRNEAGRGNDVFNQASATILDMTAAMNAGEISASGLKSSTIQVGKALNDPIKGITALTRVGVTFTKQQKDQIKALVESGDKLGAQKIILAELRKEFGGSAAASADAGKRFSVFIGNLKEQIGAKLLPIINRLLGWLVDKLPGALDTAGRWFGTVAVVVRGVVGWFQRTGAVVMSVLGPALRAIGETVAPAIKAFVGGLIPGLKTLWEVIAQRVWPILKVLAMVIGAVLFFALTKIIPLVLRIAGPVLGFLIGTIGKVIGWITNIIRWIGLLAAGFLRWITGTKTTGDAIKALGVVVGAFAGQMKRNWDKIVANVVGAVRAIKTAWQAGWNTIRDFAVAVWAGIKTKIANGINGVIILLNSFLRGVERIASKLGLKLDLPVISLVGTGAGGGAGGKGRAFQQGGVVGGRGTGDKTLILAEPGEVVIPNRPGDRRRLLRNPQVAARLGLDIGGDPGAIRLLGFQAGGIIPRVQQWIRRQDPKPYVWGAAGPNAFDCSGIASAVYGMLTGRGGGAGQRYFTTGTIGAAQGFRPGKGTFTIGVTPGRGHMSGNLAGLGFEARSSRTGIFVGSAARSVTSFARQFYLPQVGNKFVAGGGGFAALVAGLLRAILGPARAGLARLGGTGAVGQLAAAAGSRLLGAGADWLTGGGIADAGAVLRPGWNPPLYNGTGRLEHLVPAVGGPPTIINIYNPQGSPDEVRRAVLAALSERDRRARKGGRI